MDALVSVFLELVKISLTAGMIAGIILLIRAVIGKKFPRRVCYALWGVVLIRLLFPVSLPSPTSIFTPTEYTPQYTIEQDFRTNTAPQVTFPSNGIYQKETVIPEVPTPEKPVQQTEFSRPETSWSDQPVFPAESETVSSWEPSWPALLAAIWLGGAAVFLLGGAGSYLLLRQRYRTACLLPDQSLFERCNTMLRHPFRRPVRLYRSSYASSPLVIGFFRPRIILPEEKVPEEQATCMVLHELVHIRRGDHLIRLLSLLAAGIHWFNPMIWLAFRFSSKDMELSCDEAALSRLGEDSAKTYATALVELSVWQHRAFSPLLMFGESNLKSRVKNALSYKKPPFWISIAAVLVVAAGAVFLLTDPIREPVLEAGDSLDVTLAGIPLHVTADKELAAFFHPENWTELERLPELQEFSSVSVTAGKKVFAFSQMDPQAVIFQEEQEKAYAVPLGTEETLRVQLLEKSTEYAALPEAQQQILSALINAETLWGMREYADYFALRPDFVSRLSAAILAAPGEPVSEVEPDWEQPYQEIYVNLVNPLGGTQLWLWKQAETVLLTMGELQVRLPAAPFAGLFEEFQAITYQGWSTDLFDETAPGFTRLPGEFPAWGSNEALIGDHLVWCGVPDKGNSRRLAVFRLPTGEILHQEDTAAFSQIEQIRPVEHALYDLEISGFVENSREAEPFIWGISLEPDGLFNYYTNWPEFQYSPQHYRCADVHLTDDGAVAAYYNGYALQLSSSGGETVQLLDEREIREFYKEKDWLIGDYDGLENVAFSNSGNTVTADIRMSNYPFANGMVLAAKDGTGWKTRILTGSAYYAEGGLLNSFYKILDDGTIAYYLLEDAGWTVELIDPNTLETLLTMDFGGYSPEYLSLEGKAPLSISGDNFYSPRVVIQLIDRSTAAVIDRSYKLEGQRLYLLDLEQKLLSDPIELNGFLAHVNREWILTREILPAEEESPTSVLYCRPAGELLDTMQNPDLRPLVPRDETPPAQMDKALLELFNEPLFLNSRVGNYSAYSNTIFSGAFHPLRWTRCEQPPDLPPKPTATVRDLTDQNTNFASANFYEDGDTVILELLPQNEQAVPYYYTAASNYPDYAGGIEYGLESNGYPDYYSDYYTGRDSSMMIFQAENQMDILDAAALLQGDTRLRYDNRRAFVLSLQGNTAVCLVSRNPSGSYADVKAAPGLMPDGVRSFEAGGYTFYDTADSILLIFTAGDAPSAVSLAEGVQQGLANEQMLAEAYAMAAEAMPRLYRDETTFRVEQLLNYMNWVNPDTGRPAAMFYNQFYYRFAELFAEYKASDKWEGWKKTVAAFLDSHEEYAYFQDDMELALTVFLPGEVFRAAIQDAWGSRAQPAWENSGDLLQYYPEEDTVVMAYAIGFENSTHCYPVSFTEEDGRLSVQYATLYWYPGEYNPNVMRDGEFEWLGASWPSAPSLAEVQQRAAELPLETAVFEWENDRWVLSPVL